MKYQAIARTLGTTYTSHPENTEQAAVESIMNKLPNRVRYSDVALIIERVYDAYYLNPVPHTHTVTYISRVSTLAEYFGE